MKNTKQNKNTKTQKHESFFIGHEKKKPFQTTHKPQPSQGGLPRLVRLLRSHESQMCGGAAGTIQNVSREEKSRCALLSTFGAVEPLADLLVGCHVKSQV